MGTTPFPATNTGFSPAPLQTPITSANAIGTFGVAFQDRDKAASISGLDPAWMAWFNQIYSYTTHISQSGTRAARMAMVAATYPGAIYYETDTGLTYAAIAFQAVITGATNAAPIVYAAVNEFLAGDTVNVSGVLGNLGANKTIVISSVSATGFTGTGTTGTGAYISGGIAVGPVRWTYIGGTYRILQAGIVAFTATLTAADTGLILDVTDYKHMLRWSGTATDFVDGDSSGYIIDALSAPNGGVWQACDGTVGVHVLKGDGTLLTVTVPNWNGQDTSEISTGTVAVGVTQAGTVPTWQAGATTDAETTNHTHPITVGAGSVNAGTGGAVGVVTSVTTPTGNQSAHHSHTLSNANAKLNIPSPSAGMGSITAFLKYLRR